MNIEIIYFKWLFSKLCIMTTSGEIEFGVRKVVAPQPRRHQLPNAGEQKKDTYSHAISNSTPSSVTPPGGGQTSAWSPSRFSLSACRRGAKRSQRMPDSITNNWKWIFKKFFFSRNVLILILISGNVLFSGISEVLGISADGNVSFAKWIKINAFHLLELFLRVLEWIPFDDGWWLLSNSKTISISHRPRGAKLRRSVLGGSEEPLSGET